MYHGDCIDSCINCGSTLSRLKRGLDGKFKDDLASVLYAAIESPTGAFRGLNTPESVILGIRCHAQVCFHQKLESSPLQQYSINCNKRTRR
jgi:hypothetical protein